MPLPAGWRVDAVDVDDTQRGPTLLEALEAPIGSGSLDLLAQGKERVAIAVEDLTRPADTAPVLAALVDRLAPRAVTILIAGGAHAPLTRHDLLLKVGAQVLERCNVVNHHPYENLVDLGRSRGGLPIKINRQFIESELRLAVGSVLPHPYAGFGGGGKIVLPGLAGIETLEMNHRPAVTGLSGAGLGVVEGNRARAEMEEIALAAGLAAVVNIVPGSRRQPLGHFFGHPVEAHRAAVAFARRAYTRPVRGGADACILNAYPKDLEMLQVGNAFNAWRSAKPPFVHEQGTVIVTAACPHGRGHHSLHGPGMRLYRDPIKRDYLGERELIVYAPELSSFDVRQSFWSGYAHARHWDEVTARLTARHPGGGRILVLPNAPLLIPEVNS